MDQHQFHHLREIVRAIAAQWPIDAAQRHHLAHILKDETLDPSGMFDPTEE